MPNYPVTEDHSRQDKALADIHGVKGRFRVQDLRILLRSDSQPLPGSGRSRQNYRKLENAEEDLFVQKIINNKTRIKNIKLNEDLKKLQALVAALAPNSQDERVLKNNKDDQDPEGGANKGGKINEDLNDKEADKVAEEDDDKEADKDPEGTSKEEEAAEKMEETKEKEDTAEKDVNDEDKSEAAENIAQLPIQNLEELDLEALEQVERELKKNSKNMADEDKEKEEATKNDASADKKEKSEAQIPTQNSENLYLEELERVEEELKKKKKANNETKGNSQELNLK
ncbi:hypothetical protein ACLB2K_042120 [Fragaria x ananassa]